MFKRATTMLGVLALSLILVGASCSQQTQLDSSAEVKQEQQSNTTNTEEGGEQNSDSTQNNETTSESDVEADLDSETKVEVGSQKDYDASSNQEDSESVEGEGETSMDLKAESNTEVRTKSEVDKVVNISGDEFSFSPSEIRVEQGQKIKINLKNTGNIPHNLRISSLNTATPAIEPGETGSMTFTAKAEGSHKIDFVCSLPGHVEQGMVGKIIVE